MGSQPRMSCFRQTIAISILSALTGCHEAGDDSTGPQLVIVLSPVNGECVVRAAKMKCAGVSAYLRDTLKLPSDTYIAVSSPQPETLDAIVPIMKDLNAAGYGSVIGDIPIRSR